ncbi:baseplate wedge tail fiber protein connector [Synechococcus phage S-8S29]|nr:baseplate wedge tail fiber protein connector [Synechococcus phage S-8S29]
MAKQTLGLGAAANDNTGDTLRAGGDKINDNFTELYNAIGINGVTKISVNNAAVGQVLRYNGTSFEPQNLVNLTSNLDVNGNEIISQSNGNIVIAPNGTGDLVVEYGSSTAVFDSSANIFDVSGKVQYTNEYTSLANAPAATEGGYYFTVSGDDNPYVNINITSGGVGSVRAKLLTEYSSIDLLSDVDTSTVAPTEGQVLKWDNTAGKWEPADDLAGAGQQNLFASFVADTGSTTANSVTDTLTVTGGTNIATSIVDDVLTINFDGTLTTTLAALTDTDVTGITQGDSLFWNGTDWVVTRSPIIWWELNANGASDYTFNGPGFSGPTNDPTLYVMRGFTYAFDNSVQSTSHPFRIQSTQGLTGQAYTDGQSGSGTSVLYWTVPMDLPAGTVLYYQCTIHASMQGQINVIG